jgi:hypothetical protein
MLGLKKNSIPVLCIIIVVLLLVVIVLSMNIRVNNGNKFNINNEMVNNKYKSLVSLIGEPTYVETCSKNNLESATWMSPLDNFSDFGKYNGCDYIKVHGKPGRKFHPHPAIVFLIIGKYINVPEHLLGPLKHASETINIEQLFVPKRYQDKYGETGTKELALVTGSCASVTISAITVQFAIDMIEKYRDETDKCLDLYPVFRNEYDRRIHEYLCNQGITDKIEWYDPSSFDEPELYDMGDEKCDRFNTGVETFESHNTYNKKNEEAPAEPS